MQSAKELKRRIQAVENTRQITKAMEVVSATKMRRSQEVALASRPYASVAMEILGSLSEHKGDVAPPMFEKREVKKALLLVVTSDKGLAGAFNSNTLKGAHKFYVEQNSKYTLDVVTMGKKANEYFTKRDAGVVKSFVGHGDFVDFTQALELAKFLEEKFVSKEYDAVYAVYTNFISTLKQESVTRTILPFTEQGVREIIAGIAPDRGRYSGGKNEDENKPGFYEYKFEPSREAVLNVLISHLFQMQCYHIILESNASEHSARMVAMKTASDNAGELIDDLSLKYNNSRQAAITQEIVEITGGAGSV